MARLCVFCAFMALLVAGPAHAANTKIVGGTAAAQGAYPAQASLKITGGLLGLQTAICGGTLVSKTKIVTAAHCVDGAGTITAYLGSNGLWQGTEFATTFAMHPQYSPVTGFNDVAVLTLASQATQQPIALLDPAGDTYTTGDVARTVGWGTTCEQDIPACGVSQQLLEVDVPLVADTTCGPAYGAAGFDFDPATMVCAGQEGKDSCQGDSGGPLMLTADKMLKLLGVVSFGEGCGRAGFPGVYTELPASSIREWVLSQTGTPPSLGVDAVSGAVAGTAVTLHATATDPSGVGDVTWDLDDDGLYDDATGAAPSWTPSAAGTFTVRARVSDADGMVSATDRSVTVAAPPPPPPPPPPPTPTPTPTTPTTTTPPPPPPITRRTAVVSYSARKVDGRLRVSGAVAGRTCSDGVVRITVSRGGKRLATRTVELGRTCTFTRSFTVRGRLSISVRFLGTPALAPATLSKTRRIT